MGASRFKSVLLNCFLLLFSTVLCLGAAELVLRITGAAPAVTETRWGPHTEIITGPEFRYFVHSNSMGLRDSREFARDSPSTRVLFIGDSFTFGNGVSNDDTISFKTEAILNQETKRSWTVINAGQPGSGTRKEERQLRRVLNLIDVNAVVLFYFVDNDPYETQQEYASERPTTAAASAEPGRWLRFKAMLTQHSALYRFASLRLLTAGTLRAFPFTLFDQCDPAKIESFDTMDSLMRTSIHGIEQLAQEKHFAFLVVMIPRQEQLSAASFDRFKHSYRVDQYPYDRFLPQKRVLERVFQPEGVAPLDLLGPLNGADPAKYYYRYDGHLTPEGTSFVAPRVAEMIRAALPAN